MSNRLIVAMVVVVVLLAFPQYVLLAMRVASPPAPTPTATSTTTPTSAPAPMYPPGWLVPPKDVTKGPLCGEYRDGTWTIYFCDDCPEDTCVTDYGDRRAVERALNE